MRNGCDGGYCKYIRENANAVKLLSKSLPGIRLVYVAPGEAAFGSGRMWQGHADDSLTGWKSTVVKTRQEAFDWINAELDLSLVDPQAEC